MTVAFEKDVLEFAPASKLKVDREKGVIYGMKILGRESKNGGIYEEKAVQEAVRAGMYENVKCNVDHPSRDKPGEDRSSHSRLGKFLNSFETGGEVFGDLHLLKSHPLANAVMEAAENPTLSDCFGASHNARTLQMNRGGKLYHTKIVRVRHVDIVPDPGTTKGIFESHKETSMDKIEIVADSEFGKLVLESQSIFEGDTEPKAKADELGKLIRKNLGVSEEQAIEKPVTESTNLADSERAELARLNQELAKTQRQLVAREVLESASIAPDKAKITALAALDNAEDRLALVKTWSPVNQSQQGSKPRSTPANVLESQRQDEKPSGGAGKLAAWSGNRTAAALMGR